MQPPQPKSQNQGLLRILLLLVVFAGFLVIYSVTRGDPHDLSSTHYKPVANSRELDSNNERARKRKLFLNEKRRQGGGKLIDEIYQSKKKKFRRGNNQNDGDEVDNDDNDMPGRGKTPAPFSRNRKGDDVPAGQGRIFDEKHIDVVRQMVMHGRDNKYPDNGVHPYHNVHEDDLEDHIRKDKDES